jgi:hypothetical protein
MCLVIATSPTRVFSDAQFEQRSARKLDATVAKPAMAISVAARTRRQTFAIARRARGT